MTNAPVQAALSSRERDTLRAMADELIPAAEGMPAASTVNVHSAWIDEALAARPDLIEDFRAALMIGEHTDPATALARLYADHPRLFLAFSLLTAGAYLMIPEVKKLIGYPGQEARAISGDDLPEYLEMLEQVALRGPIFRPTISAGSTE